MVNAGQFFRFRVSIFLVIIGWVIFDSILTQAATDTSKTGTNPPASAAENNLQTETSSVSWPDGSWPTSTPEEQGMDSRLLANMFDFIAVNRKNIQSLLILRNGTLVVEAYFEPYNARTKHQMASASKSVTAMLLGIAIQDGYAQDLDQKITEYFPELDKEDIDPRKKDITLEHLLTMTTGLRWHETDRSYLDIRNSLVQMTQQEDWVRYILNQPMAAKPGEKFNYHSGASHLLSAIIQKKTGLTTAQYAESRLFAPLHIEDYEWEADPEGITLGGWGLILTPRDMAKLGYLYLRQGRWEDRPIVPEAWVTRSTRQHLEVVSSSDFRYKLWQRIYQLFGWEFTIRSYGYGYHWWVPDFGGFAARGHGGQAIYVIPNLDLVIVFTGGLPQADLMLPEKLVQDYILPAAKSADPLPANLTAQEALNAMIGAQAQPEPEVEARFPETTARVNGKRYDVKANALGIQSVSFTFSQGSEASMQIGFYNSLHNLTIGLDGLYRTNPVDEQESMALKGRWIDANTFVVDMLLVASGKKYEQSYTFQGDTIRIISHGIVEDKVWRMTGHIEN